MSPNDPTPNSSLLSTPPVPTNSLLRRTMIALGLVRNVVQESSEAYWYEQGKEAALALDWLKATHYFEQAIKLNAQAWQSFLQLAATLAARQTEGAAAALVRAYDCGPYTSFEKFKPELSSEQWTLIEANLDATHEPNEFNRFLALSVLHQLAKDDYALGEVLSAIDYKYASQGENSFAYLRLLGWYHDYIGDHFNALHSYAKAVRLSPNRPEGYFYRSCLRFNGQDYSGCLSDIESAITLDPSNSMLYANRGATKASAKKFAEALADFDKSLELDSANFFSYLNRGRIKYDINDYSNSLNDFNQAANIYSKNIEVYFRRGLCKEKLDDFAGALADYDFAASLDCSSPQLFNQRALLKERMGDWKGADMDRYLARTFSALQG